MASPGSLCNAPQSCEYSVCRSCSWLLLFAKSSRLGSAGGPAFRWEPAAVRSVSRNKLHTYTKLSLFQRGVLGEFRTEWDRYSTFYYRIWCQMAPGAVPGFRFQVSGSKLPGINLEPETWNL